MIHVCVHHVQVDCNICALPEEFYELSHLQLLNLSKNPLLRYNGIYGESLMEATLHKVPRLKLGMAQDAIRSQ